MILGIDIGGTSVKMGLLERDGSILQTREAKVSPQKEPLLDTVIREAKAFLAEQHASPEGIGVSATGQIDDREGTVIGTNGKIPHYEGARIKQIMEETFHVPAHVLNDANAAVLGEAFTGRAKGMQHVLMVTLGTGVGGGVISGGRLLRGKRGIAGELGHFSLYQDGMPCPCGKTGCYESYASTTALIRLAEEAFATANMNGRIIFERVAEGDARMTSVLNRWIDHVAAGLTGLIHIFNPEIVLIGGGVSAQEKLLMEPLRRKVLSGVMPRFAEGLQVEAAALGNCAGMTGAVRFWLDQEEKR